LNAIEAMPNGGELFISIDAREKIKLQEDKSEQQAVRVSIRDTGIGIPDIQLEKVFNPFFTTKSDGLGLGLSISNRLLEENGGKMEIESRVGKGTEIRIYLPVK